MVWVSLLVLIGVVMMSLVFGLLRHRQLSFDDARVESHRVFHRARLDELPQMIEDGLVEPEQRAAIERESKQDLLIESEQMGPSVAAADEPRGVRRSGLVIAFALCLLGLVLFSHLGGDLGRIQEVRWTHELEQLDLATQSGVERAYDMMKVWLDQDPENESVRMFLAELSLNLGRYQEAADGFSDLSRSYPADLKLREQSIEARYLALDRRLDEALKQDLDEALKSFPRSVGLLEIAGMEAHKLGNLTDALGYFERAAKGATGPRRQMIEQIIAVLNREAEGRFASQGEEPASSAPSQQPPEIEVVVELISDEVFPSDARLFVFARASEGPPMPLAVVRVEPLPGVTTHRLTDALAMMPSLRLSQFEVVDVVVRLSLSGQISSGGEDPEVRLQGLTLVPGLQSVRLTLDLSRAKQVSG